MKKFIAGVLTPTRAYYILHVVVCSLLLSGIISGCALMSTDADYLLHTSVKSTGGSAEMLFRQYAPLTGVVTNN